MGFFKYLAVFAVGFALAAPVQAFPFGDKDKKKAPPQTGSMATGAAPKASLSSKSLPSDRNEALRSEPLMRSAYFAREFERSPTNAQAGIDFSESLRALGRFEEAADVAHRVLLFSPNNFDALTSAAKAHIAANNGFYALDSLKRAGEIKPLDWQVWSLTGIAYDQSKRSAEAQTAWNKALSLSPNNPSVLTNKAIAIASEGKLAEAEILLRRAVAHTGSTMAMRQNLALILGVQGKLAEAETLLRQDLPPDVADQNLAWLNQRLSTNNRSWNSLKTGG